MGDVLPIDEVVQRGRLLAKQIALAEADAGQRQLANGERDVAVLDRAPFVGSLIAHTGRRGVHNGPHRSDRLGDGTGRVPEQHGV